MTKHLSDQAATLDPGGRPSCADLDRETLDATFFSRNSEGQDVAKRVCAMCPLRQACLSTAFQLEAGQPESMRTDNGVWGGMTAKDRIAAQPPVDCDRCGEPMPEARPYQRWCEACRVPAYRVSHRERNRRYYARTKGVAA